MGYHTNFNGKITSCQTFDKETIEYLKGISSTRRVKRSTKILAKRLGISEEKCIKLYGKEAKNYFDDKGYMGQIHTIDITNYNSPPDNQPSLWCDWTVGKDNKSIISKNTEKAHEYIEWMEYILKELSLRGYTLNGSISWHGEDSEDNGSLHVDDNTLTIEYH